MRAPRRLAAPLGAVLALVAGAACGPSLDRIPDPAPPAAASAPPPAPAATTKKPVPDGYVHVARRGHVTIGLAEAREIDAEDAIRIVDRLAEQFETCAVRLEASGQLVPGAGRLVVLLDERGHVTATDAKLSPGSDVAGAALLCLLAPGRALSYPPGKGTRRGFAVEAVWETSKG